MVQLQQRADTVSRCSQERFLTIAAVLSAVLTFAVFYAATGNDFVDLDDLGYVVANDHIRTFDLRMFTESFTRFFEANWHPLTMISMALDYHLWGMNPYGFHLTSILIHCSNVFLACFLFAGLLKETKIFNAGGKEAVLSLSNSGAVAAIASALMFGLHPLRVESVAWVSERKDVLCMFFMMLTMLRHIRFAGKSRETDRVPFWLYGSYWQVLVCACLALLSKPAAVSLPLVLLIMDWYPLRRIDGRDSMVRVCVEKIPIMIMAAATAFLTIAAQQYAINRAPDVAVLSRILVACKALMFYLSKTLWPSGLAPLYPHPGNVIEADLLSYILYFVMTVAISVFVTICAGKNRTWAALWLCYLASLLPVLGIIQVGGQWAADRYTYLPALYMSLLWGSCVFWFVDRMRIKGSNMVAVALFTVAVLQLVVYIAQTRLLIQVWKNSETLETREISLFPHQVGAAYYSRAKYRTEQGRFFEALADIEEALVIARRKQLPEKYSAIHVARSDILRNIGRTAEALEAVEAAISESVGVPPEAYFLLRDDLLRQVTFQR